MVFWNKLVLLAGLFLLSGTAAAREELPPWVATHGGNTGFPRSLFVTGFGMSSDDKKVPMEEKVAYARNMALSSLASSLRVQISSEKIINSFSAIVDGDEELLDEYRAQVVAKSDLQLDGVSFRQYSDRKRRTAYALAYLDKSEAVTGYRAKFKRKLASLVELQGKANAQLAQKDVSLARDTYLRCENMIGELEEIIMLQELLGDAEGMSEDDMKAILGVKSESRALWEKRAETMSEAAVQLAMKLSKQAPGKGRVQVNALMLDDSHQYSQLSSRFRALLENAVAAHTDLKPLHAEEMDFTPQSSNVARHSVAANGADYMLSGTYFIKPEEVHFYVRLTDVASGEVTASANARLLKSAADGLNLKPRNYMQALIDRKVFKQGELTGGSLNLEAWTNRGTEGLALEDGEELKIFIRVNQVCYIRFLYHLVTGERVVPTKQFMNLYIDAAKVNTVVELPESFEVCAPFGSETIQLYACTEQMPNFGIETKLIDGEEYDVLTDELAESNIRHRGIKRKKKTGEKAEIAEKRISLTTIAPPPPMAK